MDTVTEYVYYYPPGDMLPTAVTGLNTDFEGMIVVNVAKGVISLFGATNSMAFGNLLNSEQFTITPQAYQSWYKNNLSAINSMSDHSTLDFVYNSLTPNLVQTDDQVLATQGFYWVSYSQANSGKYAIPYGISDPVKSFGLTSNNLYALVKSASVGNAVSVTSTVTGQTATPANTYSTVTTGATLTPAQSQQIASSATGANTSVSQSLNLTSSQLALGTPAGQISNDISTGFTTVATDLNNIGKAISSDAQNLNTWLQVLPWAILGLGGIVVVAFALSVKSHSPRETLKGAGEGAGAAARGAAAMGGV
jgi:hypothetical protein